MADKRYNEYKRDDRRGANRRGEGRDHEYRNDNRNNRRSDGNRRVSREEQMRRTKQRKSLRIVKILVTVILLLLITVVVVLGSYYAGRYLGGDAPVVRTNTAADGEAPAEEASGDGTAADGTDEAAVSENGEEAAEGEADVQAAATAVPGSFTAPSEEKGFFFEGYKPYRTEQTINMPLEDEDCRSNYAVLVDVDTGEIVAGKNENVVISPASMTKILTLLVAAEHITDLDDTYTIGVDITDFVYFHGLSIAGFDLDQPVCIRDLLYGMILPSGADAALALANYVAGSEEAFAELMNAKAAELGLTTAHFDNCTGIYSDNNYCTVTDMAMILKAAEENALCREVLERRIYVTEPTVSHPEGIELSNWFLRKIEDKDCNGYVAGAKTGYVAESNFCSASYLISNSGKHYICCTVDSYNSWRCIYDHVTIYSRYTH